MLNHTRGRLSPQTCGSVSRQTLQPTSIPSSAAPPQAEEGEITSTAWAPLRPESCARNLFHWQQAALSLSLGSFVCGPDSSSAVQHHLSPVVPACLKGSLTTATLGP